jgi:hypothetical protein
LREDTQEWWGDTLKLKPDELEEDEEPATADADGLRRFLEDKVLAWFENRKEEIAQRPLLRDQAFGESLDPDKLERLACISHTVIGEACSLARDGVLAPAGRRKGFLTCILGE